MKTQTCTQCNHEVRTSLAVIRTRSFQRVFFHQACWDELHRDRGIESPALLPAYRVA